MRDWRGCRGLDPLVALGVENAMPLYQIGIYSMGTEPFSASRLSGKDAFAEVRKEATDNSVPTQSKPTHLFHCVVR
jgi:hypothetical protein